MCLAGGNDFNLSFIKLNKILDLSVADNQNR